MRHLPAAVGAILLCAACSSAPQVEGQVVEVDAVRKMVTLNHDAIPNVQMPAMTMTFGLANPALINGLKQGDKVRFTADWVDGTLSVTSIQHE